MKSHELDTADLDTQELVPINLEVDFQSFNDHVKRLFAGIEVTVSDPEVVFKIWWQTVSWLDEVVSQNGSEAAARRIIFTYIFTANETQRRQLMQSLYTEIVFELKLTHQSLVDKLEFFRRACIFLHGAKMDPVLEWFWQHQVHVLEQINQPAGHARQQHANDGNDGESLD